MISTIVTPRCKICNSKGQELYSSLVDHLFATPGIWQLKQCTNQECGLIWLNPMPSKKDVHLAYQNYYTHQDEKILHKQGQRNRTSWRGLIRQSRNFIYTLMGIMRMRRRQELMFLETVKPGRLLEIGCGNGARLKLLKKYGWQVEGQEVDTNAGQLAQKTLGVKIHLGLMEELNLQPQQYDAIIMHHVLEHVHDPLLLMTICHDLLKPGGTFVSITPNSQSLGHTWFKSSWRGLEPPRHLFLFNSKNLADLCHAANFQESKIFTSNAHAELLARASIEIRLIEQNQPSVSGAKIYFQSISFQLLESLLYIFHRKIGEECVIVAKR